MRFPRTSYAARIPVGAMAFVVLLGMTGCSILVGDGSYGVGPQDSGTNGEDSGHDVHEEPKPLPGTAAVSVAGGFGFQNWCAVTLDGHVKCWGDNFYGDLGNGNTTSSSTPVSVELSSPAIQVSSATGSTCAVTKAGGVFCWGYGQFDQLGNGMATPMAKTPVSVNTLESGVASISVGALYACAVKVDGSVWCWGELGGFIGVATSPEVSPAQVSGVVGATDVSVGIDTACAIVAGGSVMCWGGFGGAGTLGNGTISGSSAPVMVTRLGSGVTSISVGFDSVCAVNGTGGVECWGSGEAGQLGQGNSNTTDSQIPVGVMGLDGGVQSVAVGEDVACALTKKGTVWCWGEADTGALGNGSPDLDEVSAIGHYSGTPVEVQGLSETPIALSKGFGLAPCVVTASGAVDCWGLTCERESTPVSVALPGNGFSTGKVSAVGVAIGGDESNGFACAVTSQKETACWGSNSYGQLGDNSTNLTGVPVLTRSNLLSSSATAVSAGLDQPFACGLGAAQAQCWGYNEMGQLGNGMTASFVDAPLDIDLPSTTKIASVSVGGLSACAVTTAGALYCWGDNLEGEVGDGTTMTRETPVEVLSSGVTAVSVGLDYACAILTGGTVDCWGDNMLGQLGTGTGSTTRPTPVPGLTDVTSISAGWFSTCAVSSGNIYCWGFGDDCELGNAGCPTTGCASSAAPVQVVTGSSDPITDATQVSVGNTSACAIVGGGVLCWGDGPIGSANLSSLFTIGCAVPVTGLEAGVTDLAVGYTSACAIVDGGLQCWGDNSGGQIGNGGPTNESVATPVPGFP
jgi:alpha-tubulin suppressor-like RCC1 family protein